MIVMTPKGEGGQKNGPKVPTTDGEIPGTAGNNKRVTY